MAPPSQSRHGFLLSRILVMRRLRPIGIRLSATALGQEYWRRDGCGDTEDLRSLIAVGIVGLVMCIAATESETFQKQMPQHRRWILSP